MTTIVLISVAFAVIALMVISEKKESKESKTVYDYRENPEELDEFIR